VLGTKPNLGYCCYSETSYSLTTAGQTEIKTMVVVVVVVVSSGGSGGVGNVADF